MPVSSFGSFVIFLMAFTTTIAFFFSFHGSLATEQAVTCDDFHATELDVDNSPNESCHKAITENINGHESNDAKYAN